MNQPLPKSFLVPVKLTLSDGGSVEVGILPFLTPPEIVVWQNRVFVHAPALDPHPIEPEISYYYRETGFAVADCTTDDAIMVRLEVPHGGFVANALVPNCEPLPGVVRWGERIFRLTNKSCVYAEAFFTVAFNPETQEPALFP